MPAKTYARAYQIRARKDRTRATYCGPAALAALTGKKVEECEAAVNKCRCKRTDAVVRGVYWCEMRGALGILGFGIAGSNMAMYWRGQNGETRPTLSRWIRDRSPEMIRQRFLLTITDHYCVVVGRKVFDSCHKTGTFIRAYGRRRTRVKRAYRIEPFERPVAAPERGPDSLAAMFR